MWAVNMLKRARNPIASTKPPTQPSATVLRAARLTMPLRPWPLLEERHRGHALAGRDRRERGRAHEKAVGRCDDDLDLVAVDVLEAPQAVAGAHGLAERGLRVEQSAAPRAHADELAQSHRGRRRLDGAGDHAQMAKGVEHAAGARG